MEMIGRSFGELSWLVGARSRRLGACRALVGAGSVDL